MEIIKQNGKSQIKILHINCNDVILGVISSVNVRKYPISEMDSI